METEEGVVLEFDVLELTEAQFKDMDENEFCRTAVRLDRIQDAAGKVELSVAGYLHTKTLGVITRNGGFPYEVAAVRRDFLGMVEGYKNFLLSEAAGKCRVMELPKSISAAARKIDAGLERGADLREEDTCSKIAKQTAKINKAEKKAKDAALLEEFQAKQKPVAGDAGGGEPSAIEIRLAQMAKQYEEIAAIDADRADDMLAGQQQKIDKALAELKAGVAERMSA